MCLEHLNFQQYKIKPDTSGNCFNVCCDLNYTIKPVMSRHSEINKTKVLKTDDSLMQFESIAECSLGAFCSTF